MTRAMRDSCRQRSRLPGLRFGKSEPFSCNRLLVGPALPLPVALFSDAHPPVALRLTAVVPPVAVEKDQVPATTTTMTMTMMMMETTMTMMMMETTMTMTITKEDLSNFMPTLRTRRTSTTSTASF